MRSVVVGAILAVLVVAAAPAAAGTSADEQLAETGVLQLSDFPSGWKATARGSTSDAAVDREAAALPTCRAFTTFSAANKKNPRVKSQSFELDQSNVANTVSIYPTAARAEAAVTTFRNPKLPRCLEQLFSAVLRRELRKDKKYAKQLQSVTADIGSVDGVRLGDDVVVYQGTVDVGLKGGSSQTIGLGFVTVRVGAALSGFSYSTDKDISAALQPAIVASVSRLQRATPTG